MINRRLLYPVPLLLMLGAPVNAAKLFDFDASTPQGSWQTREEITTDHKGRQNVAVVTLKFLGTEERDGQEHFWVETEMQSYKVKRNGERKRQGDFTVLKVLMDSKMFYDDPANAMKNLQGFGREIIMQTGGGQPMAISEGGMLAGTAMKAMGVEVDYSFDDAASSEPVETPAGQFDADCINGTGRSEAKVLIKKIVVDSKMRVCVSNDVPFGMVRSTSDNTVNGKAQKVESVLMEYGTSGAESKITGEPQRMPGLGDIFGGQ